MTRKRRKKKYKDDQKVLIGLFKSTVNKVVVEPDEIPITRFGRDMFVSYICKNTKETILGPQIRFYSD